MTTNNPADTQSGSSGARSGDWVPATTSADQEFSADSLLQFACKLADAASRITLQHFRQSLNVDNKLSGNNFDPVTIADRAAEAAMRDLILLHYPTHGIYGEEYGAKSGTSNFTWVLDPIDGTRAFISGLPTWGTLIALFDGNRPVVGVMDQPFTGERYFADDLNGKSVLRHLSTDTSLRCSNCSQLAKAIMMSTAPDMFDQHEFAAQQKLASSVRLMRYGGDCYSYCLLAAGHVDLVVESNLSLYDIQALIPIVEHAGGVVTDWHGESANNGGQVVAAANVSLHRQALDVLQSAAKKSVRIL